MGHAEPLTLAEEHVLLLGQVAVRAEELLTAAAHGQWPGAELAALAGYAEAEVLRQASDEETLLFTAAPAGEVAGLARDHVRLRSAADLLARAADGEQPMSAGQAAVATRDFAALLKRHLRLEGKPAGRGARGAWRGTCQARRRSAGIRTSGTRSPRDLWSTSTRCPRTRR